MEIIKPSCELWIQNSPIDHVARCARVCYASDKTSGNIEMYKRLKYANHLSMFRHETVCMIVPYKNYREELINHFEHCPYVDYRIDYDNNKIYISTNRQFIIENEDIRYFEEWIVPISEFKVTELGKEIMRYTFKVVTQISTSRELNRVSPNNISEQSTRYVNLSKKGGAICQPHWMTEEDYNNWGKDIEYISCWKYAESCQNSFNTYNELIEDGILPQDARGVLPLDTATVCVYTYNIAEWRHIIDLRYYGITGAPHPNAKIITGMIKEELEKLGYEFINPKTI